MPKKTLPKFEWPKCHQCGKPIDVSLTMSGKYRAGCQDCDTRDGYAMAAEPRQALIKYLNREVVD